MALKIQQFDNVSEYKIKIAPGGAFTFDTGDGSGTLTINGNLNVQGETTTVGSSDLVVSDNTITVNDGESGSGVSLNTAGIIIDRGTLANAEFLWDERLRYYAAGQVSGGFVFQNADGDLLGIRTAGINTKGANLYIDLFNGSGEGESGSNEQGIITINESNYYETKVFGYTDAIGTEIANDDTEPDKLAKIATETEENDAQQALITRKLLTDYVRDYHKYNFQDKIAALTDSDTFVIAYDADDPAQPISKVEVAVDNQTAAVFKQTNAQLFDVLIEGNTISSVNTDQNLIIEADGTGVIQTSFPVQLEKTTDPSAPADGITLYSKEEADGGTGLFFINENSTNDELISRNKALLYSIIF